MDELLGLAAGLIGGLVLIGVALLFTAALARSSTDRPETRNDDMARGDRKIPADEVRSRHTVRRASGRTEQVHGAGPRPTRYFPDDYTGVVPEPQSGIQIDYESDNLDRHRPHDMVAIVEEG